MRKVRVKALRAQARRVVVRGVVMPPTKSDVRRAKKAFLANRQKSGSGTNARELTAAGVPLPVRVPFPYRPNPSRWRSA